MNQPVYIRGDTMTDFVSGHRHCRDVIYTLPTTDPNLALCAADYMEAVRLALQAGPSDDDLVMIASTLSAATAALKTYEENQ